MFRALLRARSTSMFSPGLAAGFAAGTLLHLLLVALARPSKRRLDRLLFALFIALFFWHAGNLLAIAVEPFARAHRDLLIRLARMAAFTGLAVLPPLLLDAHLEYARVRWRHYAWLFYLPLIAGPWGIRAAGAVPGIPRGPWTTRFILYFAAALLLSAVVDLCLGRRAAGHLRVFHWSLGAVLAAVGLACVYAFLFAPTEPALDLARYLLMLSSIVPSGLVGYWIFRFNFLQAGPRRSVALTLLGVLGLLAYALVIERVARVLEAAGYLPSGVTEAILVFFLIVAAEPVSRRVLAWTSRRVSMELARIEALHGQLQQRALAASPEEVRVFAEEKISESLGFPVRVSAAGEIAPDAARELTLREDGSLRVLSAHTAEALERARLIGERVRLERELAQREKMAALGEMAAFIAHRIKNPLSAINTLVQVIAEQAPRAAEPCGVIRGEIRRLDKAVRDLLRYTAPEEAGSPAPVAAGPALREAVALFDAEAAARGVALECRVEGAPELPLAAEWLHDILTSLIGNALEASPAGSRVRIGCSLVPSAGGTTTVLSVEDEGPGVPPEYQEKIFDPFFTLKPGGTGLGLALARRRAEQAGAELRCVSPARDGRGARFEVIFGSKRSPKCPESGLRSQTIDSDK